MVIELASLPLLAVTAWRGLALGGRPVSRWALIVLAALLALPLLQLVPLPPSIWRALPGREVAVHSLEMAGVADGWRPLSLTPDATWRSFLWLIPPAALFLAGSHLARRERVIVTFTVLGLLTLSLVIGALQMAGIDELRFYPFGNPQLPSGLFANRNHQAIAMDMGLPLAVTAISTWAGVSAQRNKLASLAFVAALGLLIVGAIVTLSRAGLVLGAGALTGSLVLIYQYQRPEVGGRRRGLWIIAAVAAVVTIIAALGLAAVLARFENTSEEARLRSWPTIISTAIHYFPAGAGLGSFDPVYRSAEPPPTVSSTFVNTAHNDFLQAWLEGGLAGLALLMAFLIWLGRASFGIWQAQFASRDILAQGASIAIWVVVAHSLVDYPLRTPALASIFAVLCSYAASPNCGTAGTRRTRTRRT